jgi:hypothetical protein
MALTQLMLLGFTSTIVFFMPSRIFFISYQKFSLLI